MHKALIRVLVLAFVGSANCSWAQEPEPTPVPMPPLPRNGVDVEQPVDIGLADSIPADNPAFHAEQGPAGEEPAPIKKAIVMRGRAIPAGEGEEWIVNQNTVERYSLPADQGILGFYETPYSTRQEIADIRIVPPPKGQGLANTIILETKDLLGTADVVLPVLKTGGVKEEIRVEILVIDQVSNAYRSYLKSNIKKMFPTAVVDVVIANKQTAVLNGYVERAEHVAPIENLVRGFLAAMVASAPDAVTVVNALRVVGSMQVQLRVMICEVQRNKVRDLGFDWNAISTASNPLGAISLSTANFGNRLFGADNNGNILPLGSSSTGNANGSFVILNNGQVAFQGYIRALVTNNLAKILAEPNLVTMSGQPAYFNVGGQVPVLTPQGNGTIGVVYHDFGTNLRFVPTVLGEGRVRLEVRPEVSDLNFNNGVTLNNITIPGVDVRVAETTVEMENGQTFVVAGLIQKRIIGEARKIPGLGDVPVAGALFQNKSYRQTETEVMIMITPHLVEAMDQATCELPGKESRVPNDIEYYLGSKFEPPCYNDPYRGHIRGWWNNVPGPQAQPVPPYDNYGNPSAGHPGAVIPPVQQGPATQMIDEPAEFTPAAPPQAAASPTYDVGFTDQSVSNEEYPAIEEVSLVPPPPASAHQEWKPAKPTQAWRRSSTQTSWR
jgi:Flp pilus assembly secretin CpaC